MSNQSPLISQQLKLKNVDLDRYRSIGHQHAKIDPLNLPKNNFVGSVDSSVLDLSAFEFTP
jgi:2-oxoglutarate dehydrogenase complex dehydrogenase (E1) component-like enzyme